MKSCLASLRLPCHESENTLYFWTHGAPGRTRTGTPLRIQDFESSASTNSTTGALEIWPQYRGEIELVNRPSHAIARPMFRRTEHKKIESMASILILGGVLPLCVALVGQYAFNLFPCDFCLLQRYPYLVAIAVGAASLLVRRMGRAWKFLVLLGALAFLATAALGAYHTGIERGWVDYKGGCVVDASAGGSVDDLRQQILQAPLVSCADASAMFAGLSMASWNVIFALFMVALLIGQYRFERERHEQ